MIIRRVLLVVIVIAILVIAPVGCVTKAASYVDDVEDDTPLSVYLVGSGWENKKFSDRLDMYMCSDYRNMFNYKRSRSIQFTYFEDAEAMYNQILNEMMFGAGPDIIVINSLSGRYLNLYKLSQQNAFADMDILIEDSESFDLNDYHPKTMDTGIVNGKRIMIPIGYNVNFCVGMEECFDYHNIETPDKLTLSSYLDIIEEYYSKNRNMPVLLGIDDASLLSQFFDMGEPIKKTDELRRLLDILKTERERKIDFGMIDLDNAEWPINFIQAHDWVYNNRFLFLGQVGQSENIPFRRFHLQYNVIETYYDHKMLWFPQPFRENQPVEAYVEYGFVINNNSKHKNEAFEFIEFVLSNIKQTTTNTMYYPVRKDSFDERKLQFDKLNISYGTPFAPDYLPDEKFVPKELVEEFTTYSESAEEFEYIGHFKYIYYNVINQTIEDYYNGFISFDGMIDEINNKLNIYYSE